MANAKCHRNLSWTLNKVQTEVCKACDKAVKLFTYRLQQTMAEKQFGIGPINSLCISGIFCADLASACKLCRVKCTASRNDALKSWTALYLNLSLSSMLPIFVKMQRK
jgi:hypothetical protein